MQTYSAYMDETGHSKDERQRFVGIAGLIAPVSRWETFERQWKATLELYKIPYFHMKEFAHSKQTFKDWEGKEEERKKLLGELILHMETAHSLPFGAIVPMDAFRSFTKQQQGYLRDPYYLCFQSLVAACSSILAFRKVPDEEKIALIFSDQVEFRSRALKIYADVEHSNYYVRRSTPPVFQDMREVVPLQAADIIAYEMHKEFERRLCRPSAGPRFGYQRIVEMSSRAGHNQPLFRFFTKTQIAALIKGYERSEKPIREQLLQELADREE
jgi:hypothetical protein